MRKKKLIIKKKKVSKKISPVKPQLVTTTSQQPLVEKPLQPRQAIFVMEYLKDLNGTKAAIRAGYSENCATEIASENLTKPNILRAIDEQLEARATRTLITGDKILHEMFQLANVDIKEAFEDNGDLKPLDKIPQGVRKAISGIEIDALYEMQDDPNNSRKQRKVQIGVVKKIKFWDKGRAQENLAKHLKLLTERTEIANGDGTNLSPAIIKEVFVDSPEAAKIELAPKENV